MTERSSPTRLPDRIARPEDGRLVAGRGSFVSDLIPDDALHACFVRSPYACGSINDVDTSLAAESPGVVAAYTAVDLGLNDLPPMQVGGHTIEGMDRPMLARDAVSYVGELVAVVIADSARRAEDAASLVFIDVDPGEPILTLSAALDHRGLVHPAAGTNVAFRERVEAGPEPADDEQLVTVTVDVEHPRLAPSPIEPLAALAVPEAEGLRFYAGLQWLHQMQRELAHVLGIDRDQIRITVPDVGGAFGMKRFHPEYPVVAAAALRLGRPVAWVQPRREIFVGGTHGRGQRHEVTLRATSDGRIRSAGFILHGDVGAYPHVGAQIGLFSRLVATGLYDIPRVEFDLVAAVTNLPPTGPYRGAGRPEAALAIERAVDALAHRLEMDPVEVRRLNMITSLPHRTAIGALHDSGDYRAALDRALALIDYDGARREQAERLQRGTDPIGIGIGAFIERAGGAPDSWEYASVAIDDLGEIVARTGSTSAGQGHEGVWRRVVAEVFDVDAAVVSLRAGDTAEVADSVGSFASRSAQIGAAGLWRCAEQVRLMAAAVAADLLEASPADLVVADGAFHVAGVPDLRVDLAAVAAGARQLGLPLEAEEKYSPGAQTFPYGIHAAVVEVELETGRVLPQRLVAVDDVGTRLDDALVAGQVQGSVLQGLGAALFESMQYDDWGQPLTTTFMDYLVPSAAVAAPLTIDHTTHPAPSNPLGAKGAGEGGCIGMPPAIVNAAIDALRPWGVADLQIPLTPSNVWVAIQRATR